jgi:hypothetical protein
MEYNVCNLHKLRFITISDAQHFHSPRNETFIKACAVGFVQGQVPDPTTRAGFLLRLTNALSVVIT